MSATAKFHSTTHHKTWDATTTRFNLDQGSSQLQCISSETELKKSKVWPWSDFLVCTQPNRRSLDLLVTLAYINYELRTRYLPAAYTTQMADKYRILPEEHVLDLKKPSNTRYIQCILRLILLFSKWLPKPCRVIIATSMIPSISFLNEWDFPFINNDSTYFFSIRFSTFTGMSATRSWDFDQLLPLTYGNSGGSGQNCISSFAPNQ